jgi:hypothetical protein
MAQINTTKPLRKSTIRDMFFIRRRPVFRGIGIEAVMPADTTPEYQAMLENEGFVSNAFWKEDDLNKYPIIAQDLRDLQQHLIPSYFEFNQKSRYYQNRYYLYQWVFVVGAFVTTLFGTLAATSPTPEVAKSLKYLTAAVGAVTAYYTTLSNRGEPQKRWGKTRRLAEELRMNYFKYLSHLPPFDQADRVQKLREMVIDIRVKEQENG